MDYLTVALTANFTAFVTSACLLGILAIQSIAHPWKRFLLPGVLGQFVWSASELAGYYTNIHTLLLLHVELLRLALWLSSLLLLLSKRTPLRIWPRKSKGLAVASITVVVFGFAAISSNYSSADMIRLTLMLVSTLCLVFTEQVVRNLNTHRMMKLIGLCLAFSFSYDILLFGQSIITNDVYPILLQGRAALAFTVGAALAIGTLIFNDQNDSHYLFTVSRPAAFFSSTILLSLLLIGIVATGTLYLKDQGFLGTYLFILALLVALILLFALVISRAFRQHFEVFISKHFFALKYDYRTEWLNAIRCLSELQPNQPQYYDDILKLLKNAVRANSGSLWVRSGAEFKAMAGTLKLSGVPDSVPVNEPFLRTMLKESWIYVPLSRESSLAENNRLLPSWLQGNSEVWFIAPLIIQMKLVGFVILSKTKAATEITFEDRDLMTNISTQVASHILLHQQEKVISDAKQLETYNRLSAFIMHDINNVIAQLALIGKNAQRHKTNPAFIEDMIKTVHNATTRMQELVQKFNPASKEKRSTFQVSELLNELVLSVSDFLPKPEIEIKNDFPIVADKQRLTLALKNIVRNAQDATEQEGKIRILAFKTDTNAILSVRDDGHGMSQQFINEELFRPFATTKQNSGVGIGAYLTKSYLEHLGAALSVSSQEGKGTTFEISFCLGNV